MGIGNVLVAMGDGGLGVADSVTDSHSEVGDCGKGRDKSGQDVEEAFLLDRISTFALGLGACRLITYHRDTESHGVEGHRRDDHDHENHPGKFVNSAIRCLPMDASYHNVRSPASPAFWYTGGFGVTVGMGDTMDVR